jgi:integrase
MSEKITGYLSEKRGYYYVVLNYPSVNGKRNRRCLSTGLSIKRNETKANAMLRQMIRDANAGNEVHGVNERIAVKQEATEVTGPRPEMLFSDYMLFWLKWKRSTWEEVTYEAYERGVRVVIAPYFAQKKIRLNELTTLDIQCFYTYLLSVRKNKSNTVLHHHANIRKALSDAVKLKLIPYNPAADVERPKLDNFVSAYYNAEELSQVLKLFEGTKMEVPVTLAAYYGLRRSEVVGLRWQAVDFSNQCIIISHKLETVSLDGESKVIVKDRTKNKSSFRSLPLIPAVAELLLRKKAEQEQQRKQFGREYNKTYLEYICVDEMGNLIAPDYITRTFHETLLASGLKVARFHDLRHSCASLLLANGISLKEIQVWLGHSNFSTTANIYAHLDVNCKQAAANTIANCITATSTVPPQAPLAPDPAPPKSKPKRKSCSHTSAQKKTSLKKSQNF